jgi:hypothetical protein
MNMDLTINILCLLSGPCIAYYFSQRIKISDRYWAAVGYALIFGELYLAARLFHVSFALMPFRTAISWQRSAHLLVQSLLGAIVALVFYFRDRNKTKGKDANH